jgi:CRP-like cAMP-binding protein
VKTHEDVVLDALDPEDGSDRFDLAASTGLTRAQVSAALQRLRRKGLASCGRWRETSVWWRLSS